MININTFQKEIVKRLAPLRPERIILFGSYAQGTATDDSDLDLYVVTHDDTVPGCWKEHKDIYLSVSRRIRDLRGQVSIDLIVHTRKMHEKFMQLNSYLSREIIQKGRQLL
jgi:predicted nucleotidyltransferase